MTRKPINWKKKEMKVVAQNMKNEPMGKSSINKSEPELRPGAWITVSQ